MTPQQPAVCEIVGSGVEIEFLLPKTAHFKYCSEASSRAHSFISSFNTSPAENISSSPKLWFARNYGNVCRKEKIAHGDFAMISGLFGTNHNIIEYPPRNKLSSMTELSIPSSQKPESENLNLTHMNQTAQHWRWQCWN
jgi:hypothetical protein